MNKIKEFNFPYNDLNRQPKEISLKVGDIIFVLGANGVGKSALMTHLTRQNTGNVKRILAHRQIWMNFNSVELTPAVKTHLEQQINTSHISEFSRWKDDLQIHNPQITLSNLINKQIAFLGEIHSKIRKDIEIAKKIVQEELPLEKLNNLLKNSNLQIQISIDEDQKFFASKNNGPKYSVAELSDGEKNALLLITDVITAKPNTLFIIDEPERHLHRSIVKPMFSSLFDDRKDCAFVISTHDIEMPIYNPQSQIILLRGYIRRDGLFAEWDIDLINPDQEIDDNIKQSILGSRRKILFVEGKENSLDKNLYTFLFPEISIISLGDCKEVKKAVIGSSNTESLNWLKAFGLIDADDRTPDQIKLLKSKNIFALNCYSIESIYYSTEVIKKIAQRQENLIGCNAERLISDVNQQIIKEMIKNKDNMCARICERKIRENIEHPTWEEILKKDEHKISINLKTFLEKEKSTFDSLIDRNDTEGLITRYPIKKTSIPTTIVQTLKFQHRNHYENAVIILVSSDDEIKDYLRKLLGDLTLAIESS